MITYTTAETTVDLLQIIELQQQNLPAYLTREEKEQQGFVTVFHTFEDLRKMHEYERSLAIKDDFNVVGYILAMTKHSRSAIAILTPLFESFNTILFDMKAISAYSYLVVGQVCIAKKYRGMVLLRKAYTHYKEMFGYLYDFAVTEIATSNLRSLKAHTTIGFKEVHLYTDDNLTEWSVVLWDWRKFS